MPFTLQVLTTTPVHSDDIVRRVSVSSVGGEANDRSALPSFSANGRYVVFESIATNLGANTGGLTAVYRKDLITGAVTLVSAAGDGTSADATAQRPSVSADGRYVVFESRATNLLAGVTGVQSHIFRKDLATGTIELVSSTAGTNPEQGNQWSFLAQISDDGRYVSFVSHATNLVAGDANLRSDVFRKDMVTGEVKLVSVLADGTQGNNSVDTAQMSGDGRYVVFDSYATNLVAGDVNGSSDVFIKDLITGDLTRVSAKSDGSGSNGGSYYPQISANGRYVVFTSEATDLATGADNGFYQVFRKDLVTGEIVLVSRAGNAGPQGSEDSDNASISADGRYVIFESYADNLVAGDTNEATDIFRKDLLTGDIVRLTSPFAARGFEEANRDTMSGHVSGNGNFLVFQSSATNLVEDVFGSLSVFRKNLNTGAIERVAFSLDDMPAGGQFSEITDDGRYVVFESSASNLVTGDVNGAVDIFRTDMQTGTTEIVSASGNTAQSQGAKSSGGAHVDGSGRYVVFESASANLISGDSQTFIDIFRKDMVTGDLVRISTSLNGTSAANGESYGSNISSDGRYVVFTSDATDLVVGDANGKTDIFLTDMQTGVTALVSKDAALVQANAVSFTPDVSDDGTFVVFASNAGNLVAGDTNMSRDIFRKNVLTGELLRVSVAGDAGQTQANDQSDSPRISDDGRFVLFQSRASNLVAGDTNVEADLFVKDLQTGNITRVSTSSSGAQANAGSGNGKISADGRYVTFESDASNLVAHDTNNNKDIFRKDLVTGETIRLSTTNQPAQGLEQADDYSYDASISPDGRFVVVQSYAGNLVPGDTNNIADIFLTDMNLLPYAAAIAESRFIQVALAVGASRTVSVAWGDGSSSTAVPVNGGAAFAHAFATTGVKAATVSVQDGALTWSVAYRIDLASGAMTRDTAVADTITGGAGDDRLQGDGYNWLAGRGGNDRYMIDDARDLVLEAAGDGFDTIDTSFSYELLGHAEIEVVNALGAAAIGLTGNAFANILNGNAAANRLAGGDGNDVLNGSGGNDALLGDFGNDRIYGSLGRDVLSGGNGKDVFVLDTRANKRTNLDKITDFSVKDDTIWLENKYFKVGKGTPSKPLKLSNSMFWSGTAAHDANDRIVYNKKNGIVYYDSDGTGRAKAVEIVVVQKNLKITHADFFVM